MRFPSTRAVLSGLAIAALACSGCGGQAVDVAKTIKVGQLTTGWFDAGVVDGKNKLVPSASFTVTNTGTTALGPLQVYAVFKFVGETEELGSAFIVLRGADALGPSATSKALTVRANWGFTSEQPRGQMLMHTLFQDARVEIFAKYASGPFTKLTETKIQRQLLTH